MSVIKDYLKLFPKGLKNIDKIIEATINSVKNEFGTLKEEEQEEIVKRRLICQACPFNSINAKTSEEYKNLYKEDYKTDRVDLHCSICSCNVALKTASLSSDCGLTNYNLEHPENEQELKWKKFNKE